MNIVLTGGGTAGHCMPNIALIPFLYKHYNNIYYIGSKNGIEKQLIEKIKIPYFEITCEKLRRKICLNNLTIPHKLLIGIINAKKILKKVKPNIVFSKGGYVALPVVIASHILKIPVISHESDLTLGIANKISARYSKLVLTSFRETANTIKNGRYVGAPLRKEIFDTNKTNLDFNNQKPTILITGGSLGAKAINDAVIRSLDMLLKDYNIIHIVGKNNLTKINKTGYKQIGFTNDIIQMMKSCDLIVSRAGSNTLFEILALKKPCVIIPLKNGSRGDQSQNAKYFENKGLITTLDQDLLNPLTLYQTIKTTLNNKEKVVKLLNKNPITNACPLIVDYLLNNQKN